LNNLLNEAATRRSRPVDPHILSCTLIADLKAAGLKLPSQLPAQWVVDCKSVGDGEKALVHLGRYLYRGVLREDDILSGAGGR